MEKRKVYEVTILLVSPSEDDAREFIAQHGTFGPNTQTTLFSVGYIAEIPNYYENHKNDYDESL